MDHGKTTLLDTLLGAREAHLEPGLITQVVRPSLMSLPDTNARPHTLAFIDTPGHEVFLGMREVAGGCADVALILVALDAGIQKQTLEVLSACARRRQRVVLAISKVDLAKRCGANDKKAGKSEPISFQEASHSDDVTNLGKNLLKLWKDAVAAAELELKDEAVVGQTEGDVWAEDVASTQVVAICAPNRWGLDELIKALLCTIRRRRVPNPAPMQQVLELASEWGLVLPDATGVAMIMEVRKEPGLGACVIAVMRAGELKHRQWVVCGSVAGRIRSLRRSGAGGKLSNELPLVSPGEPVVISMAWDDRRKAGNFEVGDLLYGLPEQQARHVADYNQSVANFLSLGRDTDHPANMTELRDNDQVTTEDERPILDGAEQQTMDKWTSAPVAAVLRARSAGELQAMLDFLQPRIVEKQLQLVSYGVGVPTEVDVELLRQARTEGFKGGLYVLSVRTSARLRNSCLRAGVVLREYSVFHDLLCDLFAEAGLPGPVRELAHMSLDRQEEGFELYEGEEVQSRD